MHPTTLEPNYRHNLDHPHTHAALDGCGYCVLNGQEQEALVAALPALLAPHEWWLQYQPRTTETLLDRLFPKACRHARQEWLQQAVGDALWAAGYSPDQSLSPDPLWTWGGALDVETESDTSPW